jgi:hypothetical protein
MPRTAETINKKYLPKAEPKLLKTALNIGRF